MYESKPFRYYDPLKLIEDLVQSRVPVPDELAPEPLMPKFCEYNTPNRRAVQICGSSLAFHSPIAYGRDGLVSKAGQSELTER